MSLPARNEPSAALLTFIGERDDWQKYSACLGVDSDLFFPERGATSSKAKQTCNGCPVRAECLEYAIVNGEKHGIWGGLSERERRRLRVKIAAAPAMRTQYIAEALGRFDPEGGAVFTLEAYR